MPIDQCHSPQGLLTKSAKAEIAEEITSIHCNATGAPPSLVNVLFPELPEGECFVVGKPASHSYVFGIIRHGRDLETRHPRTSFSSRVTETDPANAMEAGLILPEPGREEQVVLRHIVGPWSLFPTPSTLSANCIDDRSRLPARENARTNLSLYLTESVVVWTTKMTRIFVSPAQSDAPLLV